MFSTATLSRVTRLASLLSVLLPVASAAGPVSGVVRTQVRPGAVPATVIVYAEPIGTQAPRQSARFSLRQKNKSFQPRVLGVPIGATIDFPNDDMIFHNVFSLSGPQPFDLGLYRSGQSPSRTFTQAGTYRVFCNIHPQMSAVIVVVPTPHVALANRDGRFVLDLPPGRYRLTAESERASPASIEISADAGATVAPELTLDESGWVAAQHKNKFGKDYPKAAYKQ
jgi:plastocyanin